MVAPMIFNASPIRKGKTHAVKAAHKAVCVRNINQVRPNTYASILPRAKAKAIALTL